MFTGDGSFHMNLNEACTAVSYELPIITVIFNNSVLGMVRQWQTIFYGKRYSQTDPHRKTDFVKLADGFGLKGYRCKNLPEFQAAFADALKQKGPTWIECIIDKDERVLPMIPGGGAGCGRWSTRGGALSVGGCWAASRNAWTVRRSWTPCAGSPA